MRERFFICMIILGTVSSSRAQFLKYSNEFLSMGTGARAAGMGNAVVAGTDDATAAYWNPAGLLNIKDQIQVALMHNEQFAGIVKQDYGTIAFNPGEKSMLAVSVIRVGVDDIPNTLNLFQNGQLDYSRLSSFSAVDYGFIGSYAMDPGIKNLQLGANIKVVRRIVGEFASAWGFGFDIGARYAWNKYNFGVVFRDVTTTFNVWSFSFTDAQKQVLLQTQNKLPQNTLELTAPRTILGISRKWEVLKNLITVMPEINADLLYGAKYNVLISSSYFNFDPRIGVELSYKNLVFLRGGAMNFQKEKDINGISKTTFMPSLGAGIKINNLVIDYALANPGSNTSLPYSNIISLRFGVNRKP